MIIILHLSISKQAQIGEIIILNSLGTAELEFVPAFSKSGALFSVLKLPFNKLSCPSIS